MQAFYRFKLIVYQLNYLSCFFLNFQQITMKMTRSIENFTKNEWFP